jgi:hypothetical protein
VGLLEDVAAFFLEYVDQCVQVLDAVVHHETGRA